MNCLSATQSGHIAEQRDPQDNGTTFPATAESNRHTVRDQTLDFMQSKWENMHHAWESKDQGKSTKTGNQQTNFMSNQKHKTNKESEKKKLSNSQSAHSSPLSQTRLPNRKSKGFHVLPLRYMMPANCIILNCCSCDVKGWHNTLRWNCYSTHFLVHELTDALD